MSEQVLAIVESYLAVRKSEGSVDEEHYVQRLLSIGVAKERAKALLLNMDDAWTNDQVLDLRSRKARADLTLGGILAGLGLPLTALSYTDLFFGGGHRILMYGAIGAGVVAMLRGKTESDRIKHEKKMRRREWQKWC